MQWSPEKVSSASQSVVEVTAKDCRSGKTKRGTGFVWRRPDQVLTALHVVNGCSDVSLYFESAGAKCSATFFKVLKRADLALLHFSCQVPAPNPRPLTQETAVRAGQELKVLGYGLGQQRIDDKGLLVSTLNPTLSLQDWLPENAKQAIQRAQSPGLTLPVVRVEGFLAHGFSGGPIIDRSGNIAAVADGGLEIGGGTNWGIPIQEAESLMRSSEVPAQVAVIASETDLLFASEVGDENIPAIKCGDGIFTYDRTRTYSQLLAIADSPEWIKGKEQALKPFAEVFDISKSVFDVYVDNDNGATVVIPQGLTLRAQGNQCVVNEVGVRLRIAVAELKGVNVLQTIDSMLRRNASPGRLKWMPVQATAINRTRFDGLRITRIYYDGYDAADPGWRWGKPTLIAQGYQVLLGRDNNVLAVSWQLEDKTMANPVELMNWIERCPQLLGLEECVNRIGPAYEAFMAAQFAVELTTFPIR
jgi:Trypsin-like peptidase domain